MTRKRKRIVLLFFGLALVLVVAVTAIRFVPDTEARRRTHASNMAEAERFKRELEGRFSVGASLSSVEEYARTQKLEATQSLGYIEASRKSYVKELMITTATEPSIQWGCGTGSVGVIATFTPEQTLVGNIRTSSWSFDCM
jgi:hypothetical protein